MSFFRQYWLLIVVAVLLGGLLWVDAVFVWVILDKNVDGVEGQIQQVQAVTQWVLVTLTGVLAVTSIHHAQINGRTLRQMEGQSSEEQQVRRRNAAQQMVATASEAIARCGIMAEAQRQSRNRVLPNTVLDHLGISAYTQATEAVAETSRALTEVRFTAPDLAARAGELFDLVNEAYESGLAGELDEIGEKAAQVYEVGEVLRKAS